MMAGTFHLSKFVRPMPRGGRGNHTKIYENSGPQAIVGRAIGRIWSKRTVQDRVVAGRSLARTS